jgi:hypothetical protein
MGVGEVAVDPDEVVVRVAAGKRSPRQSVLASFIGEFGALSRSTQLVEGEVGVFL